MRSPVTNGSRACGAALAAAVTAIGLVWAVEDAAWAQAPSAQAPSAFAQPPSGDAKPYDDKLMRLSEILGAVHYLRELCGANDGQTWRDRMRELMDTEGSSALRRAKLTRSFNNGYRAYSRTYSACSQPAQTAITRFLAEGAEIADSLAKTAP